MHGLYIGSINRDGVNSNIETRLQSKGKRLIFGQELKWCWWLMVLYFPSYTFSFLYMLPQCKCKDYIGTINRDRINQIQTRLQRKQRWLITGQELKWLWWSMVLHFPSYTLSFLHLAPQCKCIHYVLELWRQIQKSKLDNKENRKS